MVTSAGQLSLKRTEVDSAIVIGNDDLAVDQRTDGQGLASGVPGGMGRVSLGQ